MVSSLFRSLVALFVGVMLVCFNQDVIPFLIRVVGLAFFLPAFLSLVRVLLGRNAVSGSSFMVTVTAMSDVLRLVFGAWLIFSPAVFVSAFVVLSASVLLIFSLFQLTVAVSGWKYLPWRAGTVVTPLLLLVASVIMIFNPFGTMTAASVVVGVCAIISGVSDIVISILLKAYGRKNAADVEISGE